MRHMKKILFLPFLFFVFGARAQEAVLFKIKFLPGYNYVSTVKHNFNMQVDFKGRLEDMDKLKQSGIKLPMIMIYTSAIDYKIQTGVLNKMDSFPAVISYFNGFSTTTLNDKEIENKPNPLANQKAYGQCNNEGTLRLDSISGKNLDENMKRSLVTLVNSFLLQIDFPEKPLKVGDSFTQKLPLNMPISGENLEVIISIRYKLIEIKDNMAYFDLYETGDFKSILKNGVLNMKGHGIGKLEFSIIDNYPKSLDSNLTFELSVKNEKLMMYGSAKTAILFQTAIAPNGIK